MLCYAFATEKLMCGLVMAVVAYSSTISFFLFQNVKIDKVGLDLTGHVCACVCKLKNKIENPNQKKKNNNRTEKEEVVGNCV